MLSSLHFVLKGTFLNSRLSISLSTVSGGVNIHNLLGCGVRLTLIPSRKMPGGNNTAQRDWPLDSSKGSLPQTNKQEKLDPKNVKNSTLFLVYLGFSNSKGLASMEHSHKRVKEI